MFKLKNVKYKDILNIDDLHIPSQKITCILGESGSGKTSLLKLLNNLISCHQGEILYNGVNIESIKPVDLRRSVIMLPQTPVIFEGNIRDNLLKGIIFSKKDIPNDEALLNVLKTLNLDKSLEQDAEKLSGGEKQRVALGRAILIDSEVLLLDEPSSSLDENNEIMIMKSILSYVRTYNKTLVFVTHAKSIAKTFSNIIIEIKKGKILSINGDLKNE